MTALLSNRALLSLTSWTVDSVNEHIHIVDPRRALARLTEAFRHSHGRCVLEMDEADDVVLIELLITAGSADISA